MILAKRLKELRLTNNLTQEHLAHELNISQKTYSNIEKGSSKITLELLYKLSSIYNMELVALMSLLMSTTPKFIETIQQENDSMSSYDIYNGINAKLPLDLLKSYREQIMSLTKLVALQEEKIRLLEAKK